MKKNFQNCFEKVIVHEGGYVDHPSDPGGATKYGLTIVTMKKLEMDIDGDGDVDKDDVKLLTHADVAPVFKKMYWDAVKADDLPSGLDWAMFDWAINSGPARPARTLQKLIGAKADGVIGPKTLGTVATFSVKELVTKLHNERQKFYENQPIFKDFGKGWTARNKETLKQALKML